MSTPRLVSVEEAARRLGIGVTQVHNLARAGGLAKVPPAAGRRVHPPQALCITEASLRTLEQSRSAPLPPVSRTPLKPRDPKADGDEPRGLGAVLALKTQLDVARERLQRERKRSKRMLVLVEQLSHELREVFDSVDELDGVADAYSQALTELIAPGDVIDG